MPELTVEQVQACEEAHRAALVSQDLVALEHMHAEDRVHVHYDGRRESKQEYLDPLRDGSVRYVRLEPYGEQEVRVAGSTGVATGDLAWTAEVAGEGTVEGLIAYTSVWMDRGSGPVQVVWHSSPTPRKFS